jgi:hypothetical protein
MLLANDILIYSDPMPIFGHKGGMETKYILSSDIKDSLNNYHGSNLSAATFVYDAEADRNVLDLANNSFEISSAVMANTTAYSVAMWVKPQAFVPGKRNVLISNYGPSGFMSDMSFEIFLDPGRRVFLSHRNELGQFENAQLSGFPIEEGVWTHLVITWLHGDNENPLNTFTDPSGGNHPPPGLGQAWLIINGAMVGQAGMSTIPWANPTALRIGDTDESTSVGFIGKIADLIIWPDNVMTEWEASSLLWEQSISIGPGMFLPTDNVSPIISFAHPLLANPFVIHGNALPDFGPIAGDPWDYPFGVYAIDARSHWDQEIDGYAEDVNITEDIIVSGDAVNAFVDGDYNLSYDVIDEAGNSAQQVSRVIKVRSFDQISNDDTSLDPSYEASGWLSTGTSNVPGGGLNLPFAYYNDIDEWASPAGGPMPGYLISGSTSLGPALEQTKVYDSLDPHNCVRIKFKYYYIHEFTTTWIWADGVPVYAVSPDEVKPLHLGLGHGTTDQYGNDLPPFA